MKFGLATLGDLSFFFRFVEEELNRKDVSFPFGVYSMIPLGLLDGDYFCVGTSEEPPSKCILP